MTNKSFLLKSVILSLIIIGAAIAIFYYMKNTKPEVPAEPTQEESITVSVYPVSLATVSPEITLYGAIEASESVQLTSTVTAFVAAVPVSKGETVTQGQTLVILDDRDLLLTLNQRKASLQDIRARIGSEKNRFKTDTQSLAIEKKLQAINKRNMARQQELVDNNMAPQARLEDASKLVQQQSISLLNRQSSLNDHPNRLAQLDAQKVQAESQLEMARLNLERTIIKAPFNGRILSVDTAAGNRARNGDRMVRMYNIERLEVRSQIPGRYLSALRNGTNIEAKVTIQDQSYRLELDRMSAEATGGQGGVDAYFTLPPDASIEIGRSVKLTVALTPQPKAAAIPALALFGERIVYRVADGRLEAVVVDRLGETTDTAGNKLTLVRGKDLNDGDVVITTRLPNPLTGMKVEVR